MGMRVLLINPPWYVLQDAKIGQNSTPLGACYVAAVLEREGWYVRILNADRIDQGYENEWTAEMDVFGIYRTRDFRQHPVWREIAETIGSFRPQILGMTIKTPAVESSLYLCELAKKINKDMTIIVGGPHPTALPDEMLASGLVDFVVRREGEGTIVELLRAISNGSDYSSIRGISYRRQGETVHNPDRELLDIDTIPYPAKHLMLDLEAHDQDDFNPIIASRGCPYSCIFCATANIWTKKVRYRKPLDVVHEIEAMHKRFDTRFFSFEDDTFTVRKDLCLEMCRHIVKEGLGKVPGFRWVCNTRPELLDSVLLREMKNAGCAAVAIGVESGNDRVLKRLRKGYTTGQVKKAAKMIRDSGMVLSAQFMVGLPFETEGDMWDTVKLAQKLEPESVMLSVATPLPKTELYTMAREMGYLEGGIRWQEMTTKNDGILFNKIYSQEERRRIMSAIQSAFKEIQNRTIKAKIASRRYYENSYKKGPRESYPTA